MLSQGTEVPTQMLVTRTLKLASLNSDGAQVRPQSSAEPPRTTVRSVVLSTVSALDAVQDVPPSHESSTSILFVPSTASSHPVVGEKDIRFFTAGLPIICQLTTCRQIHKREGFIFITKPLAVTKSADYPV